jgi:pyruvate dehydrogenase E2 component (dihydrolipoamide acetyltransferase)
MEVNTLGMYEFRLPELGEGLHEGRIDKWLVKPGDTVKEDDPIAEVENDKALVELPSPVDGVVKDIKVAEGTVATVGDLLITFEVEGEATRAPPPRLRRLRKHPRVPRRLQRRSPPHHSPRPLRQAPRLRHPQPLRKLNAQPPRCTAPPMKCWRRLGYASTRANMAWTSRK